MTDPAQPLDLAPIQARHHLALDPDACGTCRTNVQNGQHPEHEQCNRRAMLLPASDQLGYEEIIDVPEDERANLPARFHIPVWDDLGKPNSWHCAVCWGDGWGDGWPCATATAKGGEVFAAPHHGERARWDGARLAEEVLRLRAELEQARQHAAREEREMTQIIAERDNLHDIADKLAAAIAPLEVIGEHSSHNDPWQNALDYALNTPA